MIDDEKIIELFFERSEQGIRELDMKYGKNTKPYCFSQCSIYLTIFSALTIRHPLTRIIAPTKAMWQ